MDSAARPNIAKRCSAASNTISSILRIGRSYSTFLLSAAPSSGCSAAISMPISLQKAIFFDRDGVINARILGGYVRHWNEFELLPGVVETLREIKRRGYLAIIITNQRGVGMGIMSEADLQAVHEELQ